MDIFHPTRECSYTTVFVHTHPDPSAPTRAHRPNGTTDARMDWFWIWIRLGDRPLDARRSTRAERTANDASFPPHRHRPIRRRDRRRRTRPKRLRRIVSTSFATSRSRSEEDGRRREKTREGWKTEKGEKYFYEEFARTWTLVALNAATRPTKEEARSADILVISVRAGVRTRDRSSREEACIHDSSTTYTYKT